MFKAAKIKGGALYSLGTGRYIGIDRSNGEDLHVECEVQRNPDGSITVLDIREYPKPTPKL